MLGEQNIEKREKAGEVEEEERGGGRNRPIMGHILGDNRGMGAILRLFVLPFSLSLAVKYFHRKQEEPLSQTRYPGRVTAILDTLVP